MTMFTTTEVQGWIGREATGPDGSKIGRIEAIYTDDTEGGPEWFAITTGLFGTKTSFAPVAGSRVDGDRVVLAWDKDAVKGAPHCDADGRLEQSDEDRLYAYYGMGWDGVDTGTQQAQTTRRGTSDDAMTRSEERVDVSTRDREVGRARLRKWIETEEVNVTVPVRREVARLVTEPVTDANRDRALDGPDLTESEHDVVLHEEEVVVDKQVVPVERVRLETDVVEEERTVSDQVRKERIAMDEDERRR